MTKKETIEILREVSKRLRAKAEEARKAGDEALKEEEKDLLKLRAIFHHARAIILLEVSKAIEETCGEEEKSKEDINSALEYIRKRRARLPGKEAQPGELAEIDLEEEFDEGAEEK